MKNGTPNDSQIDAQSDRNRFWAAKGAPNVDLEYFWKGFGGKLFFHDFLKRAKSHKIWGKKRFLLAFGHAGGV